MPKEIIPQSKGTPEYLEDMPETNRYEKKVSNEEIESLDVEPEPAAFYRGMKADEAFSALFGKLKLEAKLKGDVVGERDNVTLNLPDAIMFAPRSRDRKGEEFLCAVGIAPLPGAKIKKSYLGRETQRRLNGAVVAEEIVIRKRGKEPGKQGGSHPYEPAGVFRLVSTEHRRLNNTKFKTWEQAFV